jgi:hypothetical protein
MYAVGIINLYNGVFYIPCGNDGLQKLHNKTIRGWRSETQVMSKRVDEVYVVPYFSQEMCEMDNNQLVEHIIKIGQRIWR